MQNLLAFGKADGGPRDGGFEDYERGMLLCEWGKQFGIEGFVREEATFEVTDLQLIYWLFQQLKTCL